MSVSGEKMFYILFLKNENVLNLYIQIICAEDIKCLIERKK